MLFGDLSISRAKGSWIRALTSPSIFKRRIKSRSRAFHHTIAVSFRDFGNPRPSVSLRPSFSWRFFRSIRSTHSTCPPIVCPCSTLFLLFSLGQSRSSNFLVFLLLAAAAPKRFYSLLTLRYVIAPHGLPLNPLHTEALAIVVHSTSSPYWLANPRGSVGHGLQHTRFYQCTITKGTGTWRDVQWELVLRAHPPPEGRRTRKGSEEWKKRSRRHRKGKRVLDEEGVLVRVWNPSGIGIRGPAFLSLVSFTSPIEFSLLSRCLRFSVMASLCAHQSFL